MYIVRQVLCFLTREVHYMENPHRFLITNKLGPPTRGVQRFTRIYPTNLSIPQCLRFISRPYRYSSDVCAYKRKRFSFPGCGSVVLSVGNCCGLSSSCSISYFYHCSVPQTSGPGTQFKVSIDESVLWYRGSPRIWSGGSFSWWWSYIDRYSSSTRDLVVIHIAVSFIWGQFNCIYYISPQALYLYGLSVDSRTWIAISGS
jgi:hypothetical protein